ncbi:MAG: hypothetical protein JWM34_3399 [Ilumatobacteraceae bacterium]|nr:hypothetical protein [Ilumatobacteraceae bacterium]
MDNELEDARQKLDKEFKDFRKDLDKLREDLDKLSAAGPEDDLTQMLKDYEDKVKKVRTGGLLFSGAHGHEKARKHYLDLRGLKP